MSIQDGVNMKENDIEFINNFKNIKFRNVCREEKVHPQNYYQMEVSPEKIHNIKVNIDNKIKKLYEDYNVKDNSL